MSSWSFFFWIGSDDSSVMQHKASLSIDEVLTAFFNRLGLFATSFHPSTSQRCVKTPSKDKGHH
jgi:hypothetical protein